jgi:hypothetical protein
MDIHPIQTGTVTIKTRQREGTGTGRRRLLNMLLDRRWTEPLPSRLRTECFRCGGKIETARVRLGAIDCAGCAPLRPLCSQPTSAFVTGSSG